MNSSEIINNIENEGNLLKTKYYDTLEHFIKNSKNASKEQIFKGLLEVDKVAVEFFNHYEAFVGKSDLFVTVNSHVFSQNKSLD